MKAIVALGIAALLFLQATGLVGVVASEPCAGTCPTDGPEGSCAPLCSDCLCCPTVRSCVQPGCLTVPPSLSTMAPVAEQRRLPTEADPADIFHIPKPALS